MSRSKGSRPTRFFRCTVAWFPPRRCRRRPASRPELLSRGASGPPGDRQASEPRDRRRDRKLSRVAGPLARSIPGIRTSVAITVVVAAWLLAVAVPARAQGAREEPRIALIIGNSAYRETPLRNPVNDARGVGGPVPEWGFRVLGEE